ncbi:MAG: M48 family peptidase [Bryobacterales bacterium]|nr:M48 family peptidase [Bryobacteraceae bacterium]MDW8354546.1 M48 family peptidase [Bryobacterales bacterium]
MGPVQVESAVLFETPEEMCRRVWRTLRPGRPVPEIRVDFCPFASARSCARLRDGCLHVRISDVFEGAPAPVLEALLYLLLAKLFRLPVPAPYRHRYRLYWNRRDVRQRLHRLRRERGRKALTQPEGQVYNLSEIFDALNAKYFHGRLRRPALGWSLRPSRRVLGHYDAAHDAIIISRLLDRPSTPRLLVEYVMFHEMLHLQFPDESHGTRRQVHPPAFRQAEKAFDGLEAARRLARAFGSAEPPALTEGHRR